MLVEQGNVRLLSLHLDRLEDDAKQLGIILDRAVLKSRLMTAAIKNHLPVLKIIVSAGSGGRGYQRSPSSLPNIYISHHPLPSHYAQWQKQGISLGLSTVRLGLQPALAGAKHLNRLEQVLIKNAMTSISEDDVVVCDLNGHVIESSAANLFWLDDNGWHTPSVHLCGIRGVMRRFILEQLMQSQIVCNEVLEPVSSLMAARSVFICNSLMQMVPVARFTCEVGVVNYDIRPSQALWASLRNQYA